MAIIRYPILDHPADDNGNQKLVAFVDTATGQVFNQKDNSANSGDSGNGPPTLMVPTGQSWDKMNTQLNGQNIYGSSGYQLAGYRNSGAEGDNGSYAVQGSTPDGRVQIGEQMAANNGHDFAAFAKSRGVTPTYDPQYGWTIPGNVSGKLLTDYRNSGVYTGSTTPGSFWDGAGPVQLAALMAGGVLSPAFAAGAGAAEVGGSSALQSVYGVGAGGFGAPLTAYEAALPISAGIDAAATGGLGALTGTAGATALSDAATLGSNVAGTPTGGGVTLGGESFTPPTTPTQVGGYSTSVPSTDYSLGGQGPGYNPVSTNFGGTGVGAPTGMGLEATTAGTGIAGTAGTLTTGVAGAAGTTAVPGTIATAGAELGGLSSSAGVFDQFINYVSNLTPSSAAKDIKSASDLVKLGSSVAGIGSGINSIVNPGISPTAAQNMTDPFASSRQQYIDQLNAVMANPSLTMSTPGYQFQLEQGLQGLNRNLAQRGMGTSVSGQPGTPASGGAGIAQQKYGQEYALSSYNNYVNRLAGLAGATQQPAQGGQAALTAQQAAQKQAQAGWGALGQGVGALSTYFGGGGNTGGTQTTGMTSPVGGYTDWQNTDMGSQDVPAYNLPDTSVDWTSGFDLMP